MADKVRLVQLEASPAADADVKRYVPLTHFLGEIDHKGESMLDGEIGFQSPPWMRFRGEWVQGPEYFENDTVTDGCWTMVANKSTFDTPAPQAIGQPAWYAHGDTPSWATNNPSVTEIISGQRYTWGVDAAFLTGVRVWVPTANPPDVTYQVVTIVDPLGANPNIDISGEVAFSATGWNTVLNQPRLILPGVVFDVFVITRNHLGEASFTWDWEYQTPQNAAPPATGDIIHSTNAQNLIQIHKSDDGGTDRSSDLANVTSGDRIAGAGRVWTVTGVTDQGAYIDFTVTPVDQGSPDGVQAFQFTVLASQPIDYVEILNFYSGDAQVDGLFSTTGTANIVLDDNAYGIDVETQEAAISEDWDLLAYNCGEGGIIGGGGGTGSVIDIKDGGSTVQADATGINFGDGFSVIADSPVPGDGTVNHQWDEFNIITLDGTDYVMVWDPGTATAKRVLAAEFKGADGIYGNSNSLTVNHLVDLNSLTLEFTDTLNPWMSIGDPNGEGAIYIKAPGAAIGLAKGIFEYDLGALTLNLSSTGFDALELNTKGGGDIRSGKNHQFLQGIKDTSGALGTAGQILSSTGTTVAWSTAGSNGIYGPSDSLAANHVVTMADNELAFTNGVNAVISIGDGLGFGQIRFKAPGLGGGSSKMIVGYFSGIGQVYVNNAAEKLELNVTEGGEIVSGNHHEMTAGIRDSGGSLGTAGQILSSTGATIDWIDVPGGGGNTLYSADDTVGTTRIATLTDGIQFTGPDASAANHVRIGNTADQGGPAVGPALWINSELRAARGIDENNPGVSGEVLKSNGPNKVPFWAAEAGSSGASGVDPAEITVSAVAFVLPAITKVGQIYVVASPPGSPNYAVTASGADNLFGNATVNNSECALYIACTITDWYRVEQ